MWRIAALVSVLGGSANADDATRRIEIVVDATVETDVGMLIGFRCDDPKMIDAQVKTVGDHNVFVVKGVAAGKTQCRVGTDVARSGMLFDVVVTDKPATPKRRN